jgi:hypothetical protein
MFFILKAKMVDEKNGTHPKTNNLEFGYLHIKNRKIMTSPKTQINLYNF